MTCCVANFRVHGLTYYNPQVAQWSVSYIPMEAEAKDHSRVLLYVIGKESRGITSMLEVIIITSMNEVIIITSMNEVIIITSILEVITISSMLEVIAVVDQVRL